LPKPTWSVTERLQPSAPCLSFLRPRQLSVSLGGKLDDVARRALTIEVDEKLLDAARAVAERTGMPAGELYERALREVLARDFTDLSETIARDQAVRVTAVAEEEGLALAYEELRALRAERHDAS
jgi:protein-disulfide isomerase-like protein with CxxC motif